jgi:hypothetical protein
VFDGRRVPFDLNKDIGKRDTILPKYEATEDGELIPGSFVAVAYTATSYSNRDGSVAVSYNLHWVIVMGEPSED